MRINTIRSDIRTAIRGLGILSFAAVTAFGAQQVSLIAGPTSISMPDGSTVPMWGYTCGVVASVSTATCAKLNPAATGWSPVVITVPTGQDLQINLTNSLSFGAGADQKVPTSLTIVGQLGGGLGSSATFKPSPDHSLAQQVTWAISAPGAANTPPAQGVRVQSFSTEVAVGVTTSLTWTAPRPGTYLLESGTHPSIQGPMGLYGMVVVTSGSGTPTAYPGVTYTGDVKLLLSEIDPVQNNAVDTAVKTTGFSETAVWSGQPGKCGDPAVHSCYPPAVNYTPVYYLINGVAFDKTHSAASKVASSSLPAAFGGKVLVRMVNAGLRMHVPTIVGSQTGTPAVPGFSLIAEDGNPLPGTPRVQSEVFLAAGKTYDVMINQPAAGTSALPVFDRQLSLSGNATTRDAGMLAYISVNGASLPAAAGLVAAVVTADSYSSVLPCPPTPCRALTVSDPAKGVIANDTNVYGVKLSTPPTKGTVTLNANGTFTYVPNSVWSSPDTFAYQANGSGPTATVTLSSAVLEPDSGITVNPESYTSTVATRLSIKAPGILMNDTDGAGYPLKVASPLISTSPGLTVTVDPNGGFIATIATHSGPISASFTYKAQNSQGTVSAGSATVTLNFPAPSNLQVSVVDGKTKLALDPQDYRWIIEEDRTFFHNPNNTTTVGIAVPQNLGTNFHTSWMPIVAQGCTGDVSCEAGQKVLDPSTGNHVDAVCDIGNGGCRAGAAKTHTFPSDVVLDPTKRYYISILPGDAVDPGHAMGGAQIAAGQTSVTVLVEPQPLPPAKISVFVFQDDHPLNGNHDAGGGVDVLAPNEPGLGQFNITLYDQAGGPGDATGQMTYDMFNMPLSNALAGTIDPATGADACPISQQATDDPLQKGITGVIPVCPRLESDGVTLSPLAGQAVIANMPPGRYGVEATPGADRIARGEEWLQTNTLDGGKAHDSFIKVSEPSYFQEYGPAGYHVAIGFANPSMINSRKDSVCAGATGTAACTHNLTGRVTGIHMSRTPDQRLYSTGSRDSFAYTQCFVSLGSPDGADFSFERCDDEGKFTFTGIPGGDWRLTVFDQWNDQIVDGYSTPIRIDSANVDMGDLSVHQWKADIYTRTFFDKNGNGKSDPGEPGLALVPTNVRFRDGSFSNFNSTDLDGYAGFNEVFPLFNWYVVETDSLRYKNTGTHVVYDAGGPVDGTGCSSALPPAAQCGSSNIADHMANTYEPTPLPANLSVPGAVYCDDADCTGASIAGGPVASGPTKHSSGRIDPPWVTSYGWQGFLGQNSFLEFGKTPFAAGENGGIHGHVVYASTRPFDDPALLLQLSWEPLVPRVTINLYQEGTAPDGSQSLKLIDTTKTSSFDDWAQGFRPDGIPNMNCPGQSATDPFFFTLKDQPFYLNPGILPNNSQFKCFDGLHNWNQLQPAPYDGMYTFPSVTSRHPVSGAPTGSSCHIATAGEPWGCTTNPVDGTPMLPTQNRGAVNVPGFAGKYVVEVVVPPGYELVKEEDKNILLGDSYIAPVTQQFGGLGSIYIMPDQAAVAGNYNPSNAINPTTDLGAHPRHEGDTGSVEVFWPCVGQERIVPDFVSLFPGSGQNAPFAGATRKLCDRKEITLDEGTSVLAKFYVFTPVHISSHFTGVITDDFSSEFDPFSPQFGEKFAPANLPVSVKDWAGNEVSRIYSDQWGAYDGLNYSTFGVNPPAPTGYVPTMMVLCMNDSGSAIAPDPLFQPGYSQFCYELPFMPGQTGYFDTPVVPTSAFSEGYNHPDCAYPDATPAIKQVNGDGIGPWISASGVTHPITITALGDQSVNNYGYSGPSAPAAPFNQKTISRHYGFGNTQGTGTVTIGGVTATVTSWSDSTIVVTLPSTGTQVPPCGLQQQAQYGGSPARCGELVITADNGKSSIDAVTVTIGGKAPTHVLATDSIQRKIDAARPGDLLIVDPGTHEEVLLMWKPLRLQGVGAASSIINGNIHPAGKLDPWRRQVNCLFGLAINGQPIRPASGTDPGNPFDSDNVYTCGGWSDFNSTPNNPQVDRIAFEGILGWDASVNGNLAEMLQEPSLMGAYEAAGITVLGKGVDTHNQSPFGVEGGFLPGTTLLTAAHCTTGPGGANQFPSSFQCNPSSIDGLSVINSSQGGGGIYVHAWGHNLQVANNRIHNNSGTLTGGITIGQAETTDGYLRGDAGNADPGSCDTSNGPANVQLPFCYNLDVNVHHNAVTLNSSTGDELFSATPAGAGGVTFCTGADNYKFNYNWVCGNLSSGDGGGVAHLGFSANGSIEHNSILFNQTTNPTVATNGGGIIIMGTAPDGLAAGLECGSVTDEDCAPGLSDGTGPNLLINANLIMGNAAESGSGGGIRLQTVNGTEVTRFPLNPAQWYTVNVTNNIISNNVAGWDGGGVSLQDALVVNFINNTVASNDTTASSGVLFNTWRAPLASTPPPGCSPDPANPPGPGCVAPVTTSTNQAAGLVTSPHTSNLTAALGPVLGSGVLCPLGHAQGIGLLDGACKQMSYPLLYNNVFWQNRTFHIAVGGLGSGNQSMQNTVSLAPTLSQPSATATTPNGNGVIVTGGTGACATTPEAPSYWDIGVRGDTGPTNHSSGFTLSPTFSVLTSAAGYPGANNTAANPTVVSQYCNGSRVPPEFGGTGFLVPPGVNEGNGPVPLFNLAAAATVDEGNNWVNIKWGPLAMTNPVTPSGTSLGNYAPAANSPVINYIPNNPTGLVAYNLAPGTDFFGNPRKTNGAVDAGAVEFVTAPGPAATVAPTSLAFGSVVVNSVSATQTLTLTNTGTVNLTTIVVNVPAPFSRTGGTCVATLNAGANCTIIVRFNPTAAVASSLSATITGSFAITGSPVSLSGTGVAAPTSKPTLTSLDQFNRLNANTLNNGASWTQLAAGGSAAIRVNDVTAGNASTGTATCSGLTCLLGGNAQWTTAFGAKQGAAFTIASTSFTNDALMLDVSGAVSLLGVPANFIRVRVNGGTAVVETTTNAGVSYTTIGTLTSGTWGNGDTITAVVDETPAVAAPTVYVWRTTAANVTTFSGAVQIPAGAPWSGGGQIGIQLPAAGANTFRVDNFAGGTLP